MRPGTMNAKMYGHLVLQLNQEGKKTTQVEIIIQLKKLK